jgi:hypothetical protein
LYAISFDAKQVLAYSATGALLRTIGRAGQGPGEFRDISALAVGRGDTLFVNEASTHRITAIAPDYSIGRLTLTGMEVFSFLPAAGGHTIVHGMARDGAGTARPLHVLDPKGQMLASFGPATTKDSVGMPGQAFVISASTTAAGTFWVNTMGTVPVSASLWTESGAILTALTGTPKWVSSNANAGVYRIWDSGDGLLWLFGSIRDPNWRQSPRAGTGFETHGFALRDDPGAKYDGTIDIIDLRSGKYLVSTRLPAPLDPLGNGFVFQRRLRDDGVMIIDVFRATVRGM